MTHPDAPARSVPSLAPFNLRDREVIRAALKHVVGVIRGNRALHDGPLTTTEIGALSGEEREIIREARTDRALRLGLLPYGSPPKPKLAPQPSSDGLASLKAPAPDWESFTEHLSWCAVCAQDGLSSCEVGRVIRQALDDRIKDSPTADGGTT